MSLLSLQLIRTDSGAQMREKGCSPEYVEELAELYHDGVSLPPVDVFYDGEVYWLADGFHRVAAATKVGFKELGSAIHRGGKRDAILHGVKANKHGLKRSIEDRRKAVMTLLDDEQWRDRSVKWIADTAHVSPQFALRLIELSGHQPKQRTGRDGKRQSSTKKSANTDSPSESQSETESDSIQLPNRKPRNQRLKRNPAKQGDDGAHR